MAAMLSKMLHHVSNIGCYLMFHVILAHEIDRIPMIFRKLDMFLKGGFRGELLTPSTWINQVSFVIYVRYRHAHLMIEG